MMRQRGTRMAKMRVAVRALSASNGRVADRTYCQESLQLIPAYLISSQMNKALTTKPTSARAFGDTRSVFERQADQVEHLLDGRGRSRRSRCLDLLPNRCRALEGSAATIEQRLHRDDFHRAESDRRS